VEGASAQNPSLVALVSLEGQAPNRPVLPVSEFCFQGLRDSKFLAPGASLVWRPSVVLVFEC